MRKSDMATTIDDDYFVRATQVSSFLAKRNSLIIILVSHLLILVIVSTVQDLSRRPCCVGGSFSARVPRSSAEERRVLIHDIMEGEGVGQ